MKKVIFTEDILDKKVPARDTHNNKAPGESVIGRGAPVEGVIGKQALGKTAPGKGQDNISISAVDAPEKEEGSVSMSVSPICMKDGQKVAYVRFSDGDKWAEGVIPMCDILNSEGYSKKECEALEDYMKRELKELKRMAAGINILDAIMGKKQG